jgi:exopolysaccharide biosynthesis predicted pyruvyltransferase EpsI
VPEEEEERGGGLGDLFGNSKNFRDLTVKKDFPLM